ncbi:hypothetical protein LAJ19_09830 [Deinococcus taeanensis]|uniref:hypothetical protein n=1 Tax=Deinococcus taeanensis TaxID=2737050 RepID=UPI001CDD084F|nr:hypothetical protein [Deinococcus taeanensis]UBV41939.1 hypothetical protein LAJ19_09830 [Deinococcus taeanensis]
MTNRRDENPPLSGETGAQTGFDTPDPKDRHQGAYSTTPPEDRVGSADHMIYEPVEVPSPKEVTGQFDHLATRDPAAMEHTLQEAEFAGAQTVAGLGGEALDQVIPTAGLNMNVSTAAALESRPTVNPDQNPGYVPPSDQGPARFTERPGDLPQGETSELQHQVKGDDTRGH